MKQLYHDLTKLYKGLNEAADAVASTLGPNGHNVFISHQLVPRITNDGARIANSIQMKDPLEDAGAYMVSNCAAKTNDDVGDGTTTTVVLYQAILKEALPYLSQFSPTFLRQIILKNGKDAIELLKKKSIMPTLDDVRQIALVSAEYPDLADLIDEIYHKLGTDALITLEDSKTYETYYEIMEGYEAKIGFVSPWFINNPTNMKAEFEDIPVFVSSKKISTLQQITPLAKQFQEIGIRKCAFIVDDISDIVLRFLIDNKNKGIFESVVVKALKEEIEDIAGATGATIIGDAVDFENIRTNHLGKASKMVVSAHSTLIISDVKNSSKRALELELIAADEKNQYKKEKLLQRSARLRGKIAILRIGADNDNAREHKKDKAEDAIHAVPAALAEGLVNGAGMAFSEVSDELIGDNIGTIIIKNALKVPSEIIKKNSGDYKDTPVKDPLKVERLALQNAIEAAGILLTTSYAIIEEKDEK